MGTRSFTLSPPLQRVQSHPGRGGTPQNGALGSFPPAEPLISLLSAVWYLPLDGRALPAPAGTTSALPAIWAASGVRISRRLGFIIIIINYYYYLIVHLLWYWAGQPRSVADPPRPPARHRPGDIPAGRRATVGILLADGGFPGDIYIYINILFLLLLSSSFLSTENPLQLSSRW